MDAIKNMRKPGKRLLALAICCLLLVAVLFTAFTRGSSGAEEVETVYRENTVARGDITVGVTETATATLKAHSISFDVNLTSRSSSSSNSGTAMQFGIEEIYVKAGQTVKEGDALVLMSPKDIQEELSDLQQDYQEAVSSLSSAELSRQQQELSALTSYRKTLLNSEFAESDLDMTVDELEAAVTKAQKELDEIETEIRTYTRLLRTVDGYDDDYANYTSAQEWYESTQAWVDSCQQLLKEHQAEHVDGVTASNCADCARLQSNLAAAQEEMAAAKLEYDNTAKAFSRKYDTDLTDKDDILDARKEAAEKLEDAQLALKKAQYGLEQQGASAGLEYDTAMAEAEIAETILELQRSQAANEVQSKSLAVQNLQEQMSKLQGYLEDNLLTAPCDGIVTAVNYEAGDSVASGAAIVTVSDSSNVYVYITVTQDDIADITLGQSASLVMDAFDEITFDGVVDSISTSPVRSASGSASYTVTVRALGDTTQIYEGMTGTVTLILRQQKNVLSVTNRAIYTEDGASYVKIKNEAGDIVPVKVETGFSDGRNVEIVSGLMEGDIYIIESQVVAGA